jgi:hypothetical protein
MFENIYSSTAKPCCRLAHKAEYARVQAPNKHTQESKITRPQLTEAEPSGLHMQGWNVIDRGRRPPKPPTLR